LEAKRLRYRVYCEERGYEPGQGGLEQDEFDPNAHHILVRSRASGKVFGTVRLVMNKAHEGGLGFPMQRVCEKYVVAPLPAAATAEISRFALTRDRTGISPSAAALMRLYLIQGIVQLSGELGLTHWCAIMEKTLLRLLRSTSLYFLPVGPAIEYHGIRQPAIFTLEDGLERMRREQPLIWSFLTLDGSLWSPEMVGAAELARAAS
jgi:N-acyl-L-homoserine lactone synthetase